MTDRQTMQQALEALNKATKHLPVDFDSHFEAITALRAKLAEEALQRLTNVQQEIEAVLAQQAEPVFACPRCGHCCSQRTPLTNDEIALLYMSHTDQPRKAYWEFARAIEQAHGIKETP